MYISFKSDVAYFYESCNYCTVVVGDSCVDAGESACFCWDVSGVYFVVPVGSYIPRCVPQISDEREYPPSSGDLGPQ